MVRLRNAVWAATAAAGIVGCSHDHQYAHISMFHCSECDDFPAPAYGPGFSQMPGSYTGPAAVTSPSQMRMVTPPSSNAPAANAEAAETPPEERPMAPMTAPEPAPAAETPPEAPPAQ